MERNVKVILMAWNPEAEKIVTAAGRLCYSPTDIEATVDKVTPEMMQNMIKKLSDMGHYSTFEHATFTFGIEGVSRALTHQLVRHRIASFSQQSQRYVKETDFDYIIPPTVKKVDGFFHGEGDKSSGMYSYQEIFEQRMAIMQEWYSEAIKIGIPGEDARFYLPNAAETKIMVTMNVRELIHLFGKRLCNRAQWEIRQAVEQMYNLAVEKTPLLFAGVGPHCVTEGVCPEGEKCCGKQLEMKKKFNPEKD